MIWTSGFLNHYRAHMNYDCIFMGGSALDLLVVNNVYTHVHWRTGSSTAVHVPPRSSGGSTPPDALFSFIFHKWNLKIHLLYVYCIVNTYVFQTMPWMEYSLFRFSFIRICIVFFHDIEGSMEVAMLIFSAISRPILVLYKRYCPSTIIDQNKTYLVISMIASQLCQLFSHVLCLLLACCRALFWIMWVRELLRWLCSCLFQACPMLFHMPVTLISIIIIYHCFMYRLGLHTLYITCIMMAIAKPITLCYLSPVQWWTQFASQPILAALKKRN